MLLHVCCGPCAIYPLKVLQAEGHAVTGYFFNPNIHPYTEYRRREETLSAYAQAEGWPVIFAREYPVEDYLRQVVYREGERCRFCYALRLRQTAGVAKHGGFEAFTTTLLVSPFQKHELIREIATAVAAEYGVPFLYRDFRPGFKEGVAESKRRGMYRQQYCGCLYSEKERYLPKRGGRKTAGEG
ncbi:hypothetical protein EDD75_0531 [Thermodesulfitimonas autotrophica]|uniref:Epoxyqueuosine reductase QueH n=1 Tax=Thermodesulfitimonas autotrophica TaxID=1894989 RepID=A0A3N5C0N1_9THEO|nr:hypothetical protein EDD75_0531 [Thermodesulfitimonas autotrophica]